MSGSTRAVALIYPRLLTVFGHLGFLHQLKSYAISGQILGLISSFLSNRHLPVVQNGKLWSSSTVHS